MLRLKRSSHQPGDNVRWNDAVLRRPEDGISDYRVVMFTDVVGSTAIGVRYGDRVYLQVVRQHDAIVRSVVEAENGFVFDTAGDGVLAWFVDPHRALRAALAIVDATVRSTPVRPDLSLSVRIGIADGTPIDLDGTLFGTAVNLAARVVGEALEGQVVCTADVSRRSSKDRFRFQHLGDRRLKGFDSHVGILQVAPAT